METKKMLDKNGLEYYTGKIKQQIPKKTSDLTNDSDFISSTTSRLTNYYTKTQADGLLDDKANIELIRDNTEDNPFVLEEHLVGQYKIYGDGTYVYLKGFSDSGEIDSIETQGDPHFLLTIIKNVKDASSDDIVAYVDFIYYAGDDESYYQRCIYLAINSRRSTGINEYYNDKMLDLKKITSLRDLSQDSTHRTVTDTEKTTWNGKQAALVSGTNIKTINNTSLLGSGNVEIEAGACVEQSSTAPTDTDIVLWIEDSDIDGSGGGGTSIEVIDSLVSTSTTDALSANQGRVLNGKITTIENDYLTSTNIKDNLTTDSATDALSAKQGKALDTRVAALEGDNLDSRLDTLEGQNLDTRLDTIEAKNLVESTNISKIVMVTEYPSTPDPDTLYVKVASL